MRTIIWGVGEYGTLLQQYFENVGRKIEYFCQTKESEITEKNGVPVVSKDKLNLIDGDVIYIAIKNKELAKQIELELNIDSNNRVQIYIMSDFIEKNLSMIQSKKYCLACGSKIGEFIPAGIDTELFRKHSIIGGGHRKDCECPKCGSYDRERWLLYVLVKFYNISENHRILHFAPESSIFQYMKQKKCDYYSCDISIEKAANIVDVTDIQFRDETFDFVIINHVLEHIVDEEKAISELKRVVKKDGIIILSFPICLDMETYENKKIISSEERLRAYGQEDHVRLYGSDYVSRLEKYGLCVKQYRPKDILDDETIGKYGFLKEDILMACTLDNI